MGKLMAVLKPRARRARRHGRCVEIREAAAVGRLTDPGAATPVAMQQELATDVAPTTPPRGILIRQWPDCPDAFIDDLLARIDIVEVVGTRVPLKKPGRE